MSFRVLLRPGGDQSLFVVFLICWSMASVVAANESKEPNQLNLSEVLQMIQADSTVNVGIVTEQHTENGKTRLIENSYTVNLSATQKQTLVSLLENTDNFSQGELKLTTRYYLVTIWYGRDSVLMEIGKEGVEIVKGNRRMLQKTFSAVGLTRFLNWASAAASMPPVSIYRGIPEPSPITLSPTDNLMKVLLNGTSSK